MPVSAGRTIPSTAGGAPVVVDGVFNGSASSHSFGTAPAAGSTVVVAVSAYSQGAVFSFTVSDNQGNSYNLDAQSATYGGNYCVLVFSAPNAASGGTFTVTVTTPGGGSGGPFYFRWGALEIKNAATTAPFDKSSSATGTLGPLSTGSTGALSSSDEMAVTLLGVAANPGGTYTEPSGFTNVFKETAADAVITEAFDYEALVSASAVNPSWNYSSGGSAAALVATYKGASAPAFCGEEDGLVYTSRCVW